MSKRRKLKDIRKQIDPKRCPECGKKTRPLRVNKVIYINDVPQVISDSYEQVRVCKNPGCKKCHGIAAQGTASIATVIKEEEEE